LDAPGGAGAKPYIIVNSSGWVGWDGGKHDIVGGGADVGADVGAGAGDSNATGYIYELSIWLVAMMLLTSAALESFTAAFCLLMVLSNLSS
jgi:hypothetical protein